MINSLVFLLSLIFGISTGFVIGWHLRDIKNLLSNFPKPEPPKKEAFVTLTDRAFTNENMVNQADSVIITPKTPQHLAWEEQQELRKMNLGPQ